MGLSPAGNPDINTTSVWKDHQYLAVLRRTYVRVPCRGMLDLLHVQENFTEIVAQRL
jgi:hypothetical protein